MGLAYDPFVSSVTESDPAPDFEQIYVDPDDSLLEPLQREEHTLIFGDYGAGKTATRLALAYRLRKQPAISQRPLLIVTYQPLVSKFALSDPLTLYNEHIEDLTEQVATDAIIQCIERLGERSEEISEHELAVLAALIHRADPALQRWLRATDAQTSVDGAFWRRPEAKSGAAVRPFVRPVATSAQWRRVVRALQHSLDEQKPDPLSWDTTTVAVRALGFRAMLILVDGIDEGRTELKTLARVIQPLLAPARHWAKQAIWLKVFVPLDLDQKADRPALLPPQDLTTLFVTVRIPRIRDDELLQIIHERLFAASARATSCRSLDEFLGSERGAALESRLIELAGGSPRVLLRLVDAFLRYYSIHYGKAINDLRRPGVNSADWDRFLHNVRRDHLGVP